jgi:hypothetical protein
MCATRHSTRMLVGSRHSTQRISNRHGSSQSTHCSHVHGRSMCRCDGANSNSSHAMRSASVSKCISLKVAQKPTPSGPMRMPVPSAKRSHIAVGVFGSYGAPVSPKYSSITVCVRRMS